MTLTWFDFVVIAILLFTTFRGLQRGFVWQLAWIAALVLCFGFAETFSIKLAPHIQNIAPQAKPPLNRWIAMLILYMGFSFLSFGVARVMRGWIEKAKFVEYDRHLGGIFGFVKGVLFCLMATFFLITLSETARDTILVSKSGHAAAVIMTKLEPVLPEELAQILEPYILELDPDHLHDDDLNSGQNDPFSDPDDLMFGQSDTPGTDSESPDTSSGSGGVIDDLWGRISGGGRGEPTESGENPDSSSNVSLDDFIRSLPASMTRKMQQSAVDAYKNATPEERDQLISQVRSTMPSEIGNVLERFNSLRDKWNDLQKPASGGQSTADRDNILATISELFSDDPARRTAFRQQVNDRLTGVPGSVATAVLADWQADLNAEPNDPDPTTNYKTNIDVRIFRQLSAAGVPMDRLSQGLRERMRDVSRQ